MTEAKCPAWDELRHASAFYETEWMDWYDGKGAGGAPLEMLFKHSALARVAEGLDAAGGEAELETARLLRVLQLALIELTFQVYRDDGDGDGPFLRDYVWPLPPLPPSIRKIFFPELFKLEPGDLPPA